MKILFSCVFRLYSQYFILRILIYERSLLQKAVRRGDVELTGKVIKYLKSKGDEPWLKRRLYVMTYEAQTVKNKNAAGLVFQEIKR